MKRVLPIKEAYVAVERALNGMIKKLNVNFETDVTKKVEVDKTIYPQFVDQVSTLLGTKKNKGDFDDKFVEDALRAMLKIVPLDEQKNVTDDDIKTFVAIPRLSGTAYINALTALQNYTPKQDEDSEYASSEENTEDDEVVEVSPTVKPKVVEVPKPKKAVTEDDAADQERLFAEARESCAQEDSNDENEEEKPSGKRTHGGKQHFDSPVAAQNKSTAQTQRAAAIMGDKKRKEVETRSQQATELVEKANQEWQADQAADPSNDQPKKTKKVVIVEPEEVEKTVKNAVEKAGAAYFKTISPDDDNPKTAKRKVAKEDDDDETKPEPKMSKPKRKKDDDEVDDNEVDDNDEPKKKHRRTLVEIMTGLSDKTNISERFKDMMVAKNMLMNDEDISRVEDEKQKVSDLEKKLKVAKDNLEKLQLAAAKKLEYQAKLEEEFSNIQASFLNFSSPKKVKKTVSAKDM